MNYTSKIFSLSIFILLCSLNCYSKSAAVNNNGLFSQGVASREASFKQLWNELEKNNIVVPLWDPKWTDKELQNRFNKMQRDRLQVYFVNPADVDKKEVFGHWKAIFAMPKNYQSWGSRYPYPVAFLYNLAIPNYSASIITLQGINFLAMEAPTANNLNVFFKVLDDYKVTDLVRLTPQNHKGREGSYPYWEGRLDINTINGSLTIQGLNQQINYFPTDNWEDHQGIEPEKLLALVKAVKKSTSMDPKMVAVHCRAGVGRTGTFIVAYTLINDIERQIARGIKVDHLEINIDKIIWELSLQRPFAVTHLPQYLTLYKLVNYYTESLQALSGTVPKTTTEP